MNDSNALLSVVFLFYYIFASWISIGFSHCSLMCIFLIVNGIEDPFLLVVNVFFTWNTSFFTDFSMTILCLIDLHDIHVFQLLFFLVYMCCNTFFFLPVYGLWFFAFLLCLCVCVCVCCVFTLLKALLSGEKFCF